MSTGLDAAYRAIKTRAEAQWPAIEPGVPMAFQNAGFQRDPSGAAWILLRVDWSGGEQASIGAPLQRLVRRYGQIWLDCFAPIGAGDEAPLKLATEAALIFECQEFDGVVCEAMAPGAGASDSDDGLYFGESVNIPFYYDEER
jgi:hypothetical protein